jgi:hypothetical protein
MKSLRLISLIAALATTSASALAQPDGSSERSAEYQRGRKAILAKDWKTAYDIFTQLWTEQKTYDVALHLGHSELRLRRYRDAAEHLAYGIAGIPFHEPPEVTARAQNALRAAKEHVLTLVVTVEESGADVYLDESYVGRTPLTRELYVESGQHTVRAARGSDEIGHAAVEGKAGQQIPVRVELRKSQLAETPAPAAAPARSESTSSAATAKVTDGPPSPMLPSEPRANSARTTVLIVGAAVTGLALGSAALFAWKAAAEEDDAERSRRNLVDAFGQAPCRGKPSQTAHACDELVDSLDARNQANTFVNGSLVVAGVAAVATGAAFFLMPKDAAPSESRVRVLFTGQKRAGTLLVTGRF